MTININESRGRYITVHKELWTKFYYVETSNKSRLLMRSIGKSIEWEA